MSERPRPSRALPWDVAVLPPGTAMRVHDMGLYTRDTGITAQGPAELQRLREEVPERFVCHF